MPRPKSVNLNGGTNPAVPVPRTRAVAYLSNCTLQMIDVLQDYLAKDVDERADMASLRDIVSQYIKSLGNKRGPNGRGR